MTGARSCPDNRIISSKAVSSAMTSTVSYSTSWSSSQRIALWHHPQYGLIKSRTVLGFTHTLSQTFPGFSTADLRQVLLRAQKRPGFGWIRQFDFIKPAAAVWVAVD